MYTKNKSKANKITNNENIDEYIKIDIRARGYYLISHVKDSINISDFKRISFIAEENKDKKLLLYCHSGATAAEFGDKLVELGYNNIYYYDDNYFNMPDSWIIKNS